MFTLTLGMAVAQSDASDWTTTKKAIAITQMVLMDFGVVMLCCW